MVAGLKKNVGCKAEKIIPKKIKKPEITKTLNISSGGDNERHKEREGGGKKPLVLTASAPWEVIRSTLRKATLLE